MIRYLLPGLLLIGCATYTAQPLDPDEILEQVKTKRATAAGGDVVSLARATELMREHGPRIRDARAANASARAFADTPTPRPNPRIDAAPAYLRSGSDRWGGEAALGWSVFLGGRRKLTDDVNAIRADAAVVEVAAVEREEYLGLRRDFIALALNVRGAVLSGELEATVRASQDILRRLAASTALDIRELELEALAAQAALLTAEEAENEARAALAARTGVPANVFETTETPMPPEDVPTLEQLHQVMLHGQPELARLRALYDVAEKELRLEIARQYPALDLGLGYEREDGVDKFSLSLGIEIPVFDRNQPGIAAADAHRTELRRRFESQVSRGLAAVEAAHARLELRRKRHALMRDRIAPAAAASLDLARRSVQSGSADALRFLTVLRLERGVRLELLDAERAVFEAWNDLEEACGAPLLRFATEPKGKDQQ